MLNNPFPTQQQQMVAQAPQLPLGGNIGITPQGTSSSSTTILMANTIVGYKHEIRTMTNWKEKLLQMAPHRLPNLMPLLHWKNSLLNCHHALQREHLVRPPII